jgi:hypothetical protein
MQNVGSVHEDLRMSDKGELFLAKMQLELTVKDLSEEIETLSDTNYKLMQDLKTRYFFDKYQDALQEITQLKLEQESLIDYRFQEQRGTESMLIYSHL